MELTFKCQKDFFEHPFFSRESGSRIADVCLSIISSSETLSLLKSCLYLHISDLLGLCCMRSVICESSQICNLQNICMIYGIQNLVFEIFCITMVQIFWKGLKYFWEKLVRKRSKFDLNPTLYGLQDVRVLTGDISRTLCRKSI